MDGWMDGSAKCHGECFVFYATFFAQGNYFPYWSGHKHFPSTFFVSLFVSSGKHEFLMRIFRDPLTLYLASSACNELYRKYKKKTKL